MLVLHCLMLSQFFGDPLLFGSQFLRGGVRKLASSPQTYTALAHIPLTLFVFLAVFASLGIRFPFCSSYETLARWLPAKSASLASPRQCKNNGFGLSCLLAST